MSRLISSTEVPLVLASLALHSPSFSNFQNKYFTGSKFTVPWKPNVRKVKLHSQSMLMPSLIAVRCDLPATISARQQLTIFSLERIRDFLVMEHEPSPTEEGKPPAYWPSSGALRVMNLSARYSDGKQWPLLSFRSFH